MEDIKKQLEALVNKYKDKPEPEFMSKEYIDRRFDRIRYVKLRKQLNMLQLPDKKDIVAEAQEIFKE